MSLEDECSYCGRPLECNCDDEEVNPGNYDYEEIKDGVCKLRISSHFITIEIIGVIHVSINLYVDRKRRGSHNRLESIKKKIDRFHRWDKGDQFGYYNDQRLFMTLNTSYNA